MPRQATGSASRSRSFEVFWSGPHPYEVPTRSTAEVLKELIGGSERELVLVSYSATEYEPVLTSLAIAVAGGVEVTVVVETLQGAGGAIAGRESAAAFGKVPGGPRALGLRRVSGHTYDYERDVATGRG